MSQARDEQSQTQGVSENAFSQDVLTQPMDNIVWGRIYGKHMKVRSIDLNTQEFKAGRSEKGNLIFSLNNLSEKRLCRVSKEHFVIKRENCDIANPVYIMDLSRNGTFVNGEKIGINKCRILQDQDVISIVEPSFKALVFKDLSPNEAAGIPEEITAKYYVSRKLGSGACGTVRLIYDRRTCTEYAMKIVKKNILSNGAKPQNLNDPQRILNEAEIMKNLSHPCVIKMHDIVDKPDAVYMVLELMKGGDLLNRIVDNKRLSERVSKLFFYQMCHAVKYLHDTGITHRDLKPDNVLLESTDEETLLKVSDFGLSKFVGKDSVMRTLCGTPLYVAPEVLMTGGRGAYTKKVDIWSLGVVLYTCLSGTLPFSDDFGTPASEQIKRAKFRFSHPCWKNVSQRAMSLIKSMLVVDPNRRPSIDEVLNSAWLKDNPTLRVAKRLMKIEVTANDMQLEQDENFLEPPTKRLRR